MRATNDVCGVPLRRPHQKRLAYSSFSSDVDHYRSSFYATFSTRGVIFVSLRLPPFSAVTAERCENCHRTSSLAARGKVTCLPACSWSSPDTRRRRPATTTSRRLFVQPVEKILLVPRLDRKDFSTFAIESLKNIIFLSIYLNLSLLFLRAVALYEIENEALKRFSLFFLSKLKLYGILDN